MAFVGVTFSWETVDYGWFPTRAALQRLPALVARWKRRDDPYEVYFPQESTSCRVDENTHLCLDPTGLAEGLRRLEENSSFKLPEGTEYALSDLFDLFVKYENRSPRSDRYAVSLAINAVDD